MQWRRSNREGRGRLNKPVASSFTNSPSSRHIPGFWPLQCDGDDSEARSALDAQRAQFIGANNVLVLSLRRPAVRTISHHAALAALSAATAADFISLLVASPRT